MQLRADALVIANENDLRAQPELISQAITERTKIIFLANPNNPTGTYLNAEDLEKLCTLTPKHILLVIDEAYADFVKKSDYQSALCLVERYDNIVITRTFSKIYGLASLRLGWAYTSPHIAQALNNMKLPFNISTPAMKAGLAALDDQKWIEKALRHNEKWKRKLKHHLDHNGLLATQGRRIFFSCALKARAKAQNAWRFFGENGLILRQMDEYGLENYLRLSIGTSRANRRFIKLVKKLMQTQ